MKKNLLKMLLILPAITLVACGKNNDEDSNTFVVKDAMNREVRIVNNPTKFVCLGPGCLRQYTYVADPSQIIGIEATEQSKSATSTKPYMNKYPNASELPVIGQGGAKDSTNAEQILALKPDVIFTSYPTSAKNAKVADLLSTQTNTPVVSVGYNSNGLFAQEIYDSLKLIGKITGHEKRANDVVKYFEDSKAELQEIAEKNKTDITAYIGAVNHKGSHGLLYTTGDFPIFDVLGIKNIAKEKGYNTFQEVDKEFFINNQPDKVFLDAGGLNIVKEEIEKDPSVYKTIDAFTKEKPEVYVEMPFVFYSNNFDVALANAYYVGSVVYKDAFKNFNIKTKFNEIMKFLFDVELYDKVTSYFGAEYGPYEFTL